MSEYRDAPPPRSPWIVLPEKASVVDWLGHPVELLCEAEHTAGLYTVQRAFCRKNSGPVAGHSHSFGESFYLLSGAIEFTAGNVSIVLTAGDFIHIEGGTAHRFRAIEDSQLIVLCAPAGFDVFQRRASEEIKRRAVKEDRSKSVAILQQLAFQFGIELDPPPEAWAVAPNIRIVEREQGDRIAAVGDIYRFLAEGDHTSSAYSIWHAIISPGGGPPPHMHHWEEEGFHVLKGKIAFYADGRRVEAGPGTFINLPRGGLHRFHNESDENSEALIMVAPAGLEQMFRITGQLLCPTDQVAPKPSTEELSRLFSVAQEYGLEIRASH